MRHLPACPRLERHRLAGGTPIPVLLAGRAVLVIALTSVVAFKRSRPG